VSVRNPPGLGPDKRDKCPQMSAMSVRISTSRVGNDRLRVIDVLERAALRRFAALASKAQVVLQKHSDVSVDKAAHSVAAVLI
jgi:hypothetical protein